VELAGKVVVVTGGGDGIGREVVLELPRRGAGVAAEDIREESVEETAGMAPAEDRLVTFAADVTDRAATVSPGAIATNITARSGVEVPAGAAPAETSDIRTTSPEGAARIIVDGIESGALQIFVGRDSRA
jgi:short-subunit dehydrogenase